MRPWAKTGALVVSIGALVAATVGLTIAVEHRVHGMSAPDEHGEHGPGHHDHDEHGDGKATKKPKGSGHDEHGDEHDEHDDARHGKRVKLTDEARKNAELETAVAAPGRVSVTLSLPGEVQVNADALAHVTPRVSGTVRDVTANLGAAVRKGEVLATMDSRELADLQRAAAAAGERQKLAKANFDRLDKLHSEGISSEKDWLAAKQALAEANIEAAAAAQALAAAGSRPGKGYELVAPIDGTIIEKHCAVGEVLKDDSRVFVIADLSSVWIDVQVYAKDLARVREGQAVRVVAEGVENPAFGTISFIGAVASERTRTARARVVLATPTPGYRPNLFVTAHVAIDEADAKVVVDEGALQTVDGKEVVFVVEKDGSFEAHPVELGRRGFGGGRARVVEVIRGIDAGLSYVSKNAFILKAELGKSEAGHEH